MKRTISLIASLMLACTAALCGCSDKKGGSGSSVSEDDDDSFILKYSSTADETAVPESGAQPQLKLSQSYGKPGETVEVTMSITGADGKWGMCGVHFSYPQELKCKMKEGKTADYKAGEAMQNLNSTAAVWTENRTEKMVQEKLYSLFIAAIGTNNEGLDGDIATFYLTIPEDAALGTVYPLEFFEVEGDMFLDNQQDAQLQGYAFSHWQNGSITVG